MEIPSSPTPTQPASDTENKHSHEEEIRSSRSTVLSDAVLKIIERTTSLLKLLTRSPSSVANSELGAEVSVNKIGCSRSVFANRYSHDAK